MVDACSPNTMSLYGINLMKRDITLGAFWFTLSLWCIVPLAALITQPLTGFIHFFGAVILGFLAKVCIDKSKECWFPEKVTNDKK